MDSRKVLRYHMRVFKLFGLWPSHDCSIFYKIWSIICILLCYIGEPISQMMAVFFAKSVNDAVDHLVMTSTIIMAAIKGMNVLIKRKKLAELFRLMEELDQTITPEEHERVFKKKFLHSDCLFFLFCINYIGSWTCVGFQTIMSKPEHRLYSSTYFFSNEFLKQRNIYVGGLIYQAIANLVLVFVDIAADTYGASLLHVLGGQFDILCERLQQLGENCEVTEDHQHQEANLVELCEKYLKIIRYSKLLEGILSFTLFTQFGVSGVVLCTCAYQLSVVRPSNDFHTFLFSIVYSFAMVTEIFVPSYFGSLVLTKSENLSYSIFKSNWIPAPKQFKRAMQIFTERTLKPITIFAASVFMLNLVTLLKILKTAYSLFALLKNTQTN